MVLVVAKGWQQAAIEQQRRLQAELDAELEVVVDVDLRHQHLNQQPAAAFRRWRG